MQRPTGEQQGKVRSVSARWRDEGRGEVHDFYRVVVSPCQKDLAGGLSKYAMRHSSVENMFVGFHEQNARNWCLASVALGV